MRSAQAMVRCEVFMSLFAIQILNGLQLGLLMFMVAAGLTLVFGVMDFINLAHGVQYMIGAYLAAVMIALTGHYVVGLVLALIGVLLIGLLLEHVVFRPLYQRSHLDQVLATFGLILFLNQGVKMVFGASPLSVPIPSWFEGAVLLGDGILYPLYRFVIIAAGLIMALLLWLGVEKTRIGMQVRAGASHPDMLSALGVDVRRLFMLIFALGSVLAGFAGALAAPILSVEPGMGDQILILAFVVIVIGGIGSIRGAFAGALLVGLIDTLARSYMVDALRLFTGAAAARGIANGLSSMFIYILMAIVLFLRPQGLFPARGRS
jgi:branched-chain amino acid transport system permease protein